MSHRAPDAPSPAARDPDRALANAAPSIGALLRDLGLSPRKALGQHFLVSPGVLARILDAADIAPRRRESSRSAPASAFSPAACSTGARA